MEPHYIPKYQSDKFNCPFCRVYSVQHWSGALASPYGTHFTTGVEDFAFSKCEHCEKWSCWHLEKMIVPNAAPVAPPHAEMPAPCLALYEEARSIVARSPKAAAALVRLNLQLLMKELGEKGDHIDTDIQSLVNKGLDVHIQQALDYCRLVGNNAVHPGTIDMDDDPDIAPTLFTMINLIVEERIARPKRVREAVSKLPEDVRKKIEGREAKK